jgi:hypothetical protein
LLTSAFILFGFGGGIPAANAAEANAITICTESELRQAVEAGGNIQFRCSGIITLSRTIDITRDVTLDGGAQVVTISGGAVVRLFNLAPNVSFELRHLTLADGWAQGTNGVAGGVGSGLVGADSFGGAIHNAGGTLRLVSCILSNNVAKGGIGAVGTDNSTGRGGAASGGAIFCRDGGSAHIVSSLLVSNRALGGRGGEIVFQTIPGAGGTALGGALASTRGGVFVTNSELRDNVAEAPAGEATARGGALGIDAGELVLVSSSLVRNRSVTDNTRVDNTPGPGSAFGGALHLGNATGLVARSLFNFNEAQAGGGRYSASGDGFGGAIHSLGDLRVSDSSFMANTVEGGVSKWWRGVALGGGIFNGGTLALYAATQLQP